MTNQHTGLAPSGVSALQEELIRRRLGGRGRDGKPRITRADRTRPLRLSSGQRQLWFLSRLDPGSPEYLMPVVLKLHGDLDMRAMRHAFRHLVARHEILHSRYEIIDAQPALVAGQPESADFTIRDLTGVSAADREILVTELVEHETLTPFDLGAGLPVRGALLRVAADEHILVLVVHHIACDENSLGILMAELGKLYRAIVAGVPPALPPVNVQ
jgi:hypothetical protein